MTIRRRMKQTGSLGDAIDARRRSEQALEQRDTLGGSAAAPLSSGGSTAGGGGVTNDPALPESFVTGLAGGSGNPLQDGEITITGSGAATVTQDELAGEIDVHAPDYTAGDGLSLASEEFAVDSSVVRTTGNQAIAGLKTFSTAPQTPATPTNDDDLTNKDYVDERTKVVHRQVFPAAGSRDSIGGNNEINLPWETSAYPVGASLPTLTLDCLTQFSFNSTPVGVVESSYVQFVWTSTEFSNAVTQGAQFAIGANTFKHGSVVDLHARVLIENIDRLDSLYLSINDDNINTIPATPSNLLSQIQSDEWTNVVNSNLSIQNLSDVLFIVLTANGTSDSMKVGNTKVKVQALYIEQRE
ncbi:hypothetical protein KDL29_07160 [bacterium]|nr:hypothetical protein [bacterium]